LDLGESRSPTQIFQQNLLLASHELLAYVCAFGPGLMVMMAMVMMVMVMVIIVPEALRQVGWLRQR
jgi:cation transport ATPase